MYSNQFVQLKLKLFYFVRIIRNSTVYDKSTVVSRKYPPPPFANLALVENAGGAYTRDAAISLVITPSLPVKLDLIVSGVGATHEVSLSARQRDVPDTTGRLMSFDQC